MPNERRILIVEDDVELVRLLNAVLADLNMEVHVAGNGRRALSLMSEFLPSVILMEMRLPDMESDFLLQHLKEQGLPSVPVLIAPSGRTPEIRQALSRGVFDYLTKPLDFDRTRQTVRNAVERFELLQYIEQHQNGRELPSLGELRGASIPMQSVYTTLQRLAPLETPVLLMGDPGTEKVEAAEALHDLSSRPGRLQKLNLATLSPAETQEALPVTLEAAHGGSCLIDSVHLLDEQAQALLLAAASAPHCPRLIVGGDGRLAVLLEEGRFRRELYGLFSREMITLPRLADRGDDVLQLAEFFLLEASAALEKSFRAISNDAERALLYYDWPGNVSELRLAIHQAVSNFGGPVLRSNMLPSRVRHLAERASGDTQVRYLNLNTHLKPLWLVEKEAIEAAMQEADGNPQHAARFLGISPAELHRRLRQLALRRA